MPKSVDVRDENSIDTFEKQISINPITIVLIYADWCGHCKSFKKNVWSKLSSMKDRRIPMASVRDDQFSKTSLSNAKIKGYPTVLVVDKNKKIADFDDGTNALPNHNDLEKMTELVKKEPDSILTSLTPKTNRMSLTPKTNEATLTSEATSLRVPNMKDDSLTVTQRKDQFGGGSGTMNGSLIDSLTRLVNSRSILTRRRRGGGVRKRKGGQKLKRSNTRRRTQ